MSQEDIREIIREENRALLERYAAMRPLLTLSDLARTLRLSERTTENRIKDGDIRPLWVGGVRRFHPDAVDAYLRSPDRTKTPHDR